MTETTRLECTCGQTHLEVLGAPIASVECCCSSCREEGLRLEQLEGAPDILTDYGATPFVMYRKDRVRLPGGKDALKAFRRAPEASTRRVVTRCCNSPFFLEFERGHWLSLYAGIWPPETRPPAEMRTMVGDLPPDAELPDDMPNPKTHSIRFFARLLGAWAAMGFRTPKLPPIEETDA